MTIRPATTDQQPAVYGATQPARLVITETVAASRTQGDGPWTTAEAILGALDREGYTVAPRASEAVMGDGSPTPDVGAAQGREDGSAAESEPRPMRPEDVPSDLVDDAVDAWHDAPRDEHGNRPMLDDLMRHILAAVIPAIRAQVADDLRHQLQAEHDRVRDLEGATLSEERKIARHQGALAEAIRMLDRIARGDQ